MFFTTGVIARIEKVKVIMKLITPENQNLLVLDIIYFLYPPCCLYLYYYNIIELKMVIFL